MPAQYDAIKASLAKRSGGSTDSPAVKTRASKIFIAGAGRNKAARSSRAKQLHADRKTGR